MQLSDIKQLSQQSQIKVQTPQTRSQKESQINIEYQIRQKEFQNDSYNKIFSHQQFPAKDSRICGNCQKLKEELGQYEEHIQAMNQQMRKKQKVISGLQQQIVQLKLQDQYLMKSIQKLRDTDRTKQAQEDSELSRNHKITLIQLNYAKKEIAKLTQWLRQQKQQVFRFHQCVKMKDEIIGNLQKSLQKLKLSKPELKLRKKQIKPKEQKGYKNDEQDELNKFRRKAKQLQQQVYQLTQQLDSMRNDNSQLRQQISRITQQNSRMTVQQIEEPALYKQESIQSPILLLKQSIKINSSPELPRSPGCQPPTPTLACAPQSLIVQLLSRKCQQLEVEIQKLLFKVEEMKMNGSSASQKPRGMGNKEYSFSDIDHQPTHQANVDGNYHRSIDQGCAGTGKKGKFAHS